MTVAAAQLIRDGRTALGIELGSTRIKACLIDLDDPSVVLATGSHAWENRLQSGNWLLVYNDTRRGRNSLAVSLSADEGATWKWTRHLEKQELGSYHYPAVIQAKDGNIHVVYSYFVKEGKSMKHARFNEAWVKQGD